MILYKLNRFSKKECCQQCRFGKFKGTVTKWSVQKQTHSPTEYVSLTQSLAKVTPQICHMSETILSLFPPDDTYARYITTNCHTKGIHYFEYNYVTRNVCLEDKHTYYPTPLVVVPDMIASINLSVSSLLIVCELADTSF